MVQFRLTLALAFILCFAVFATARTCVADQSRLIYIHTDGSIDPPTAPISTVDNITYTLTGDIFNESIVIERNNTVVDGALHTIAGTWSSQGNSGVQVSESSNVTIKDFMIREASIRINPYSSYVTIFENTITDDVYTIGYSLTVTNAQNNTISKNSITDSGAGIFLYNSRGNRIFGNNIIGNGAWGISIGYYSSNNTIYGNNIKNNFSGIALDSSSNNNVVYHNNFANNYSQLGTPFGSANFWDNGFEGNFWSDYTGTDSNQDGIGDTPYTIEANNTDHYPLMGPFQSFNVSAWNLGPSVFAEADVISNISISTLNVYVWLTSPNQYIQSGQPFLALTLAPQYLTAGFCRMTLPNNILNTTNYTALVDLTPTSVKKLASNETYTTLYLTFNGSALDGIMIIPEFPSFIVLPLFMIAASLAVVVCKRRDSAGA